VIYFDSSATLKLVHHETESPALVEWLAGRPIDPLVSSRLGRIEVLRGARRYGDNEVRRSHEVMAEFDFLPLDDAVQDLACDIGEPLLRALDALHLATAVLLGPDLTAFVAYDQRLVRSARAAGLPVASPGAAA
jgi:predicted nucleic acid-binding protein